MHALCGKDVAMDRSCASHPGKPEFADSLDNGSTTSCSFAPDVQNYVGNKRTGSNRTGASQLVDLDRLLALQTVLLS